MKSSLFLNLQKLSLIETLFCLIDLISAPVKTIPETKELFKIYSNFAFLLIITVAFFTCDYFDELYTIFFSLALMFSALLNIKFSSLGNGIKPLFESSISFFDKHLLSPSNSINIFLNQKSLSRGNLSISPLFLLRILTSAITLADLVC